MARPALIPPFEAPAGTLFVVEAPRLRIITEEGGETLVRLADFFGFLVHLSIFRATTYVFLEPLRRFLAAEGIRVPDGDYE